MQITLGQHMTKKHPVIQLLYQLVGLFPVAIFLKLENALIALNIFKIQGFGNVEINSGSL